MDPKIIQTLQTIEHYPSVSILLPTHRTIPANELDRTLLKNLAKEAEERLLKEFSKREVDALITKIKETVEQVDVRKNLDGLGLFINENVSYKVDLHCKVRERVVIDKTFATRDLVMAINRAHEYYILSVSGSHVRLFTAHRDELEELTTADLPMNLSSVSVSTQQQSMNVDQQKLKEYFNRADKSFLDVYHQLPLPVVLAGVDERTSWYREVADRKDVFFQIVSGNFDKHSVHDFGKAVWPQVEQAFAGLEQNLIDQFKQARSSNKQASGLQDIWNLAIEGRIEMLLVEEDFHKPGKIDSGNRMKLVDDPQEDRVSDDVVDELVEMVMKQGGKVTFVQNGALSDYGKIGAILRF
jgi:hypothetical protein